MKSIDNIIDQKKTLTKAEMKAIVAGNGDCLKLKETCTTDIQCCSINCAPIKKGDKERTCQAS